MNIKGVCLAIALLTALPIAGAIAQDVYPTRTVTIVVGYPAGRRSTRLRASSQRN